MSDNVPEWRENGDRIASAEITAREKPPPCIGTDPLCPCQDGMVCHYEDTPTTKGWPIP